MKIYPPFLTCIKYFTNILGYLLGFMLLLILVLDLVKSRPLLEAFLQSPFELLAIFAGLASICSVATYLLLRIFAWSIEPTGVKSPCNWGRNVLITWADIDKIGKLAIDGIPFLMITSASSKNELCVCTFGVNSVEIHAELCRYAGPDHFLTHRFRPTTS